METSRLFLKGESISELTEYNFSNMIIDKIKSSIPVYIPIYTIKHTDQEAAGFENLTIVRLVGVRRVLQDIRATKPKVVIEVELINNDYIRLMKALGNGYSIAGYSIELKMRVSSLSKDDVTYLDYSQSSNSAICSKDYRNTNKRTEEFGESTNSNTRFKFPETNENPVFTDIKPTIIKRIPYGKGIESYSSLLKALTMLPENYEFTFNHKMDKEVTGLIKDVELDYDTNTTFLEVSFANDTIASKATKLFIEGKMKENTYYILPVLGSKTTSDIRTKLKSKVAKSTEDILNNNLEKSNTLSTAERETIIKVINTLSSVENNHSAFSFKKHTQEDTPKEFELKVNVPIMDLKHNPLINNRRKENYLAIVEVMDASFKCPIVDLSVYKNINGSIEKTMATVSVSAKALKAMEMYGLSLKGKAGVVVGRIIKRNTGDYVGHISIPSQEDLLYYNRRKSLKDFDGDTLNLSISNMPLRNPTVKTIKIESEIKNAKQNKALSRKKYM